VPSQLVQLQPILIKVDGANLDDKWFNLLEMAEVDLTLGAPDMVALHFSDPNLELADDATFAHGKEIVVSALNDSGSPVVIATVEVASLEPDFRGDGSVHFVVRGYGKWNRLQNGRKCMTFQQMTDSDIASRLAGNAGLSASVEATSVQYEYLVQWQQTDMEFLLERAERIGYEVYQSEGNLVFKPAPTGGSSAFTFAYADNLMRFQPRFSITGQMNTVKVRGWDMKKKEAFTGEATPAGVQGGMGKTGAAQAQSALGLNVTEYVTDGSTVSAADAANVAQAIASRVNCAFFEADGECTAAPGLRPGMVITISNVGTRFSGNYRVSGVQHQWSQEGFSTRFTVLGRNGHSLAQAMNAPPVRRRIDGLMVGIVSNINDADGLGRIRVKLPTLGGSEEIESFWARVAMPMAGPQRGMMFYPEVNDEVLVGFEDGDPAHAVVVGSLWGGRDKPPLASADLQASGKIKQRIIKTKVGHEILIEDTQGSEKIQIKDKIGAIVLLDSNSKFIHVKDSAGNEIKLDGQGNSVLVKSKGAMTIEATNALTIKAASISMQSTTGVVEVKAGTNLVLSANANADLKANANLTVQGNAMVSVKSSAMLQIQGTLVKIN
jgi:uncharacterized protein involved in type VI secretion and phage assembly